MRRTVTTATAAVVLAVSTAATLPQTAAKLPLADTIAALRQALDSTYGAERRGLAGDLRWALVDQARLVRDDLAVLELALNLAEAGDEDAIEALKLADELEPLEAAPASAGQPTSLTSPTIALLQLDELVSELAAHRRAGLDFAEAWQRATAQFGLTGQLARTLRWSRPAWKASYERANPPAGFQLSAWSEAEPSAVELSKLVAG